MEASLKLNFGKVHSLTHERTHSISHGRTSARTHASTRARPRALAPSFIHDFIFYLLIFGGERGFLNLCKTKSW